MHKKILLAAITFLMAAAAYLLLSMGDQRIAAPPDGRDAEALRRFVTSPTTQGGQSITEAGVAFSPGEKTLARIYDDVSGRLKYQFEAKTWEPVSEADFRLQQLQIQIFSPRGEITTITADEAEVTLARRAKNRVEPKRGRMHGQVHVIIDRTTAEWREANPELADRDAHPEELTHIHLADAQFDLEQAELTTDGPLVVESVEATIDQVQGLKLQWNQADNRLDALRFTQGGRMTLHRGGRVIDFAMPGADRDVAVAEPLPEEASADASRVPQARAMQPMTVRAPTADEAAAEVRREGGLVAANQPRSLDPSPPGDATPRKGVLRDPDSLAADVAALRAETRAAANPPADDEAGVSMESVRGGKRIHTYSAVFQNRVVLEQKDGDRTIGRLEADRLEVNFDFGQRLKSLTRSRTVPASAPAALTEARMTDPPAAAGPDETKLVLTWDGPLEMKPMRVDPAAQTGHRFDAVAIGSPVKVESEQGNARCDRLVYRHERGQVWLEGTEAGPVELWISETRRLSGREVFFDQRRGLARVDGGGRMIDERGDPSKDHPLGLTAGRMPRPEGERGSRHSREPVEIRWSQGVDLELGFFKISKTHPQTGEKLEKRREYLQRAWFHGDVRMTQGSSSLRGDEVAATFGPPTAEGQLADHIRHLNMTGDVRLVREDEQISAQRLDVQMILTEDQRNVPSVVDGAGRVVVRQGKAEFRAEQMHVVLGVEPDSRDPRKASGPGSGLVASRVGIRALDASGDVYVSDPERNLRIRQAATLQCLMREGNQLVRATILGADPDRYARVRYGDVAIHGHRIDVDMDAEAVDVAGPGAAWMVTHKDFSGRKLKKPTPVKTTWEERMQFRLAKDYGLFLGRVRSTSQSFALACDKLTIRFGRTPPVREEEGGRLVDRFWLLGPISGDRAEIKPAAPRLPGEERSRPVYVVAEGHAEALHSNYLPAGADGSRGRLLSRLRLAGDRIVADLLREQMSIPGPGSLLIEDYQFDAEGRQRKISPAAQLSRDPLMSSVRGEGPSQTLVTWQNSMDFFVDRNLVAFDKGVTMIHRSGQEVVLQDELAVSMQLNINALREHRIGRKAELTCGYLLLEFVAGGLSGAEQEGSTLGVRATDLQRLIAKQAVHLQEGTKSLMGAHLQYLKDTEEVRLEGSDRLEARIIDQDEANQRFNMWKGPLLTWNRATNQIEAPGATIRASRR